MSKSSTTAQFVVWRWLYDYHYRLLPHLKVHTSPLQSLTSSKSPLHDSFFPLVIFRVRFCAPPPHGLEQSPQSPHAVYWHGSHSSPSSQHCCVLQSRWSLRSVHSLAEPDVSPRVRLDLPDPHDLLQGSHSAQSPVHRCLKQLLVWH